MAINQYILSIWCPFKLILYVYKKILIEFWSKNGLLKFSHREFHVWKGGNSRLASSSGFGACSEKKIGLSCCQRTCWCGNWLYRALRSWCHFPRRITDIEVGKLLKNRPQPQQPSRRRTSFQHRDSNQRKRHIPSMYAHTNSPLFGKKSKKKSLLKR